MKRNVPLQLAAIMGVALLFTSCKKNPWDCDGNNSTMATVKVFATGLNNPRGLKFGPDGSLYVAEGGKGGSDSTVGQCMQVPAPVGPYKGSRTGASISKISDNGTRTVISDHFPSSVNSMGQVSGVGDIAFIGNQLYAAITGAGCSHGVSSIPNSVMKLNSNGTGNMITDLSEYLHSHPVKNPEQDDFEPDGDWYSMISANGNLYAIEANHGELVKITTGGAITRIADISASQGHIVPTTVIYNGGNFLVGNLHTFPIVEGSSSIYKITESGQVSVFATGFTTILGLVADTRNRIYVLENTTGNPFPTPGTGRVVRLNQDGSRDIIATGLNLPTAITFGPDGNLYVSNVGFGPASIGGGQVLQLKLNHCDCELLQDLSTKVQK